MDEKKYQIIIFGGIGVFVVFLLLVILGVIPGLRKQKNVPSLGIEEKPLATLDMWTYDESSIFFNEILKKFNEQKIKINIKNFDNYEDYKKELLESMAVSKSPDIFMIPSTEIPAFANKINPLKKENVSFVSLQNLFPEIVVTDILFENKIYGLPLSIDTLALIYNRDLFSKEGITYPPRDWNEFVDIGKKLTKYDESGNILQSGAALGKATNVENAPDILYAIVEQLGKRITQDKRADLTNKEVISAFSFYTQFAMPTSSYYFWNDTFQNSLDDFAKNKVGMIFGFQKSLNILREKNPFLNFALAEFPQISTTAPRFATSAKYNIFTVSRQSKKYEVAWNVVYTMTTNEMLASSYLQKSKKPPALLSLIEKSKDDPELSVFVKQALYAKSWYGPNRDKIDKVIASGIELLLNKEKDSYYSIFSELERKINVIINDI
jgi:ABC-type glycerol-3-phosphate transport system substrate-binding protein